MKKLFRRFIEIFFAPTLPFRAKLFNILCLGGLLTALIVSISGFVTGVALANSIACGITAILAVLLLLVGLKTRRYQLCFFVSVVLVFFILYPVMFFAAGGYRSGMPNFFVFAAVFTVFMLEGWKGLAVVLAEIAWYVLLCVYAYYHPESVIFFGTEFAYMSDVLVGILSVSAVLGATLFLQLRLYNNQQKKLQEAYRDLEEQTRLAQSSSRAKTDFLAQMSHEIRTPMNAVIGMSELALRENLNPQAMDYVMNIRQAGNNLLAIINDILDFSKIESGKLDIIDNGYRFASLLNDVLTIVCIRLNEKPLLFVTRIDSSLPAQLVGDETRIRQILLNLLTNAVKYTREGHIVLNIQGEKGADDSEIILCFEVADTGIGIKPEDMEKLFGSFVQINMKQNQAIEGTGLGLAITRQLCRAMGGDVTASSVYGEGSVFAARIPQKINSAERFAAVENPQTKSVLVYEDLSIHAASLCWSLENLGVPYTLVTGEDGFLEALRQETAEKRHAFIFVSQAMYEKTESLIEPLQLASRLVALADFGYEPGISPIRLLARPTHTLSIANVLNYKTEFKSYEKTGKTPAKFTAPSVRVLIVDDVVTNLKVAQGILLPYEMVIDICTTGPASIELVKNNRYDLVFMDHMMPGMDGIEATAAIRAWENEQAPGSQERITIIALTANAISGMREMFLERGFNDYLTKPIEILELHEILKRWIPREKQIVEKSGLGNSADDPVYPSALAGRNVDGIDLAAGMERYQDESVYLEILRSYAASMPDFLDVLRSVSRETLDSYTITVHGIKGASYQICAGKAGREAEALETAARAKDWETVAERNGNFIGIMERLLEELGRFLEEPEEPRDGSGNWNAGTTGQDGKPIILAVDDMPLQLTAIRTILRDDYDVRLAKSPLEALAVLNTIRADLVLADIEMPEMSGFEFVERLRTNPEQKDVPVIFVTSHETPDIVGRMASAGTDYVVKPVIPRILLEKVRAALETAEEA
jgi:signal transduction histidine kinase/CheY-like chemotaxis protein